LVSLLRRFDVVVIASVTLGFVSFPMLVTALVELSVATPWLLEIIFINDVSLVGWVGWERWVSSV
jgi:hypothetical protein